MFTQGFNPQLSENGSPFRMSELFAAVDAMNRICYNGLTYLIHYTANTFMRSQLT